MLQTFYSTQAGGPAQGVSLDNTRRAFDFGPRIAYLGARESLFVSYLMRLSKAPTTDPVFKHLERRDQWQKRRFRAVNQITGVTVADQLVLTGIELGTTTDKYGRELKTGTVAPEFVLPDQTLVLTGQLETAAASGTYADARLNVRVTAITATAADKVTVSVKVLAVDGDTAYAANLAGRKVRTKAYAAGGADANKIGFVIGSAFAEATGAPEGWVDELFDREGYTQIFKTSVPLMSGTAQATVHRGIPDEWARAWAPKMKEHKLDLTRSMLFNIGGLALEGSATKRYTNGFIPYIEKYGYVDTTTFTYAGASYDNVMGFFEYFLDPERGVMNDVLAFTSRKVISWMNKLGDSGFLKNTVTANAYQIRVDNVTGAFGHNLTRVWTPFGTLNLVEELQLRGPFQDYLVLMDPSKVHYRPLAGNGISRDTKVFTNVQDNDMDGRKDMIMTEAGLQIDLPECHAVIKFS